MNILSFVVTLFIFAPLLIRAADEVVSGQEYRMQVLLSRKYVTANTNGNVYQYDELNDGSQVWRFESVGNGRYAIFNGKLAMTVENGNEKNGNNIFLSEYTKSPAQHFNLNRADSAFYIIADCSVNAALDVYDISKENGANIDQWDYWGGDNQKFYIIPVGGAGAATSNSNTINGNTLNGNLGAPNPNANPNPNNDAYLFAFFQGNAPEKEQLSYALSTDAYNFKILNNGNSVWKNSVGTGCLRDPFIIKGEDGYYYLLATDMRSYSGWDSNRNIVTAKSADLIRWTDTTLIEVANKFPLTQGADRVWAPQAIYDPEKQSYMIYFAVRVPGRGNKTIMHYAYSKDFKKFDTAVELLFAPKNGNEAIDSDIIYQNNKYYMYYKDETKKTINLATAEHASGPYQEIKQLSDPNIEVEGCNIYHVHGTSKWLMMSDAYVNGYFVLQETTDLVNFRTLNRNTYGFNFTPRHGYVIPITAAQYNALLKAYPSNGISPINVPAPAPAPAPVPANAAVANPNKTTIVKTTTVSVKATNVNTNVNTTTGTGNNYTYPNCQTTTTVVFSGKMKWGVENNKWCIIQSQGAVGKTCSCWSKKLGYSCCTESDAYYIDNNGQWGYENGQWCGIMKC